MDYNNYQYNQDVQNAVDVALKEKKKKKRKKTLIVIAVIVAVIILGSIVLGSGGSSENVGTTGSAGETAQSNGGTVASKEDAYEVGTGSVETWTDSINEKWIKVAVPVKNTGSVNLYLSSCTIDVEDENGSLVTTLDMVTAYPQIIQPGETAWYYEDTTLDENVTTSLKAIPHEQVEKATDNCIRYQISEDKIVDNEYYGCSIKGRVENITSDTGSEVYIVANLFDANGNLICNQMTSLDNDLQAGEKIGFEISNLGYEAKSSQVASYKIYAYPYQYNW